MTIGPANAELTQKTSQVKETNNNSQLHVNEDIEAEIFITQWCPYCKQAINFLESRGINPVIYDIEKDQDARRRKNKLDSKQGVPFAIIDGTPVHGFSESYYELIINGDL